ncbi:hypothetical protein [Denitromonas ohlonensis]|uniref:Uncharacterized protein n=2 Tax=Denitromonas TaxID=139331 RepID=A0A557RLD1_9RHOO|nr:hypothetical protein [Denitromonas ohlonensis]TVO65946.1 hypothetical protein FHP90_10770 [Denitromonas ohlonensis]TVO79539.1 hypothetical protein FHP89_01955 [Denitromonas ohlonensis]
MIKTGEALTLDKNEAYQLRELLDSLTDFSKGLAIAETAVPDIREAVWGLQKKLKRADAASGMGKL